MVLRVWGYEEVALPSIVEPRLFLSPDNIFIRFVEGAGEVNRQGLVGFVGVREGKGLSCRECGELIVDLALVARPGIDYKVLSHLRPPEEAGCIVVAFVG